MNCDKLFDKIDELSDKYVDILEDICNIESPTAYKEGVDKVGRYFIEYAKERTWDVDVCFQQISGNAICITVNPEAKGAPIALSGHMDTVHPVGSFGTPAVKRIGKNMYGPGTRDCKGGLVGALLAIEALCQCGFDRRPILFLLQSDEENGSATSKKETIKYICDKAANAEAFLNLEGIRGFTAVLTRKGIMRIKFVVTGKAAHSSECYNGVSAIAEAAHKIIELEKLKDMGGITCNCGIISGGNTANTVPERCEFIADIRFVDSIQRQTAYNVVRSIAERTYLDGCSCEILEISYRPPMEYSEKNEALLRRMNEIYKSVGLTELTPREASGGSDAAYVTERGIPCVDSIAVSGGPIHTIYEYADIDSVAETAKRIASVIYCL